MTDKKKEEIDKGRRAKLLLDDPILKEAFEKLEILYKDQIFRTQVGDEKERTHIYLCHNTLHTVKAHLQEMMQTGELAEESLKEKKIIFQDNPLKLGTDESGKQLCLLAYERNYHGK